MAVRTTIRTWLAGAVFAAAGVAADDFDFEVGATYDRTQLDAEQTINTNLGTIFNSIDVDTDAYSLFGNWYFTGLSDANGPRARAAFVDRASILRLGYAGTDSSLSAATESTDPAFPEFDSAFKTNGDAYSLDGRYVWRESGWFAAAGIASVETSVSGAIVGGSSTDSTAWRLGVGKYLFENTSLALDYGQSDQDGGDATNFSAMFSHLGNMGSTWQYAVDLGYSQTDSDLSLDFESWRAGLSLYPNRDFEFGVSIAETDADFAALDSTSYEGFASWFVTPSVVLAARYRIDDVGFLGSVLIPSADTTSDADQDSVGFGITVRF